MATLDWTIAGSEGSRFSRGKHDFYAIIIREIPEDNPKDCVVELYATDKPMTVSELNVSRDSGHIQPISRSLVSVDSPHFTVLTQQSIESMKVTAELRENEMPSH
jgi:hypothetical protein